jgi:hypothetical protein
MPHTMVDTYPELDGVCVCVCVCLGGGFSNKSVEEWCSMFLFQILVNKIFLHSTVQIGPIPL